MIKISTFIDLPSIAGVRKYGLGTEIKALDKDSIKAGYQFLIKCILRTIKQHEKIDS